MTAAGKNKARFGGGLDAGSKKVSIYNVNNKSNSVKARVIRLRQSWHLEIADFQCFAIFICRSFLEYAPPEIRARFMGPPSQTPCEIIELAEVFLLLYSIAEDKATATGTKYSLIELWQAAIQLAGGAE